LKKCKLKRPGYTPSATRAASGPYWLAAISGKRLRQADESPVTT
jgi:hypothetical protein